MNYYNVPSPTDLSLDATEAHFQNAKPVLVAALKGGGGTSEFIRALVWSIYNGRENVNMLSLCSLDNDHASAVIALIHLRVARRGEAETLLRDLLDESGELDR